MKNVENAKRSSWKNDMPFIWPKATKENKFYFYYLVWETEGVLHLGLNFIIESEYSFFLIIEIIELIVTHHSSSLENFHIVFT